MEWKGESRPAPNGVDAPPASLGEFIIDGDLDQFVAGSKKSNTQLNRVNIAQPQLEQPPLETHDMWHLGDDEERKVKRLNDKGLDISWVTAATKKKVTDQFYEATAREGKCVVVNCEYSTLSRCKSLYHVVTHHVLYVTDFDYLTSHRDSAVKHLRNCHNRQGSITQKDAGSWRRLREATPKIPIIIIIIIIIINQ